MIYRDEEREQAMLEDAVVKEECLSNPTMTKIIGMELCGSVSYPPVFSEMGKPWPPLAGPMEIKLELLKRDTMTGYAMLTKWIKDGRGTRTVVATFNTPGSRIDRELTLEMDMNPEENNMRFNLRSPWKRIEIGVGKYIIFVIYTMVSGYTIYINLYDSELILSDIWMMYI